MKMIYRHGFIITQRNTRGKELYGEYPQRHLYPEPEDRLNKFYGQCPLQRYGNGDF